MVNYSIRATRGINGEPDEIYVFRDGVMEKIEKHPNGHVRNPYFDLYLEASRIYNDSEKAARNLSKFGISSYETSFLCDGYPIEMIAEVEKFAHKMHDAKMKSADVIVMSKELLSHLQSCRTAYNGYQSTILPDMESGKLDTATARLQIEEHEKRMLEGVKKTSSLVDNLGGYIDGAYSKFRDELPSFVLKRSPKSRTLADAKKQKEEDKEQLRINQKVSDNSHTPKMKLTTKGKIAIAGVVLTAALTLTAFYSKDKPAPVITPHPPEPITDYSNTEPINIPQVKALTPGEKIAEEMDDSFVEAAIKGIKQGNQYAPDEYKIEIDENDKRKSVAEFFDRCDNYYKRTKYANEHHYDNIYDYVTEEDVKGVVYHLGFVEAGLLRQYYADFYQIPGGYDDVRIYSTKDPVSGIDEVQIGHISGKYKVPNHSTTDYFQLANGYNDSKNKTDGDYVRNTLFSAGSLMNAVNPNVEEVTLFTEDGTLSPDAETGLNVMLGEKYHDILWILGHTHDVEPCKGVKVLKMAPPDLDM